MRGRLAKLKGGRPRSAYKTMHGYRWVDDHKVMADLAKEQATYADLDARLTKVKARRAAWLAAQDDIASVAEWCAIVRPVEPDLSFEHERLLLDALGLCVNVYRATHTPQYEIMARVPVGMPVTQMAHDLPEYVADCVSRLNN